MENEFELPSRIFEEDLGELLIGIHGFHFYRKDEIGMGQIGYRCNDDYVKIEDWIGDNYFVIGYETLLRDLVVVDMKNDLLPVYSVVCDDWSMMYPLANSIEDYRKILRMIMGSDLSVREVVEELILKIKKINQGIAIDYWKDFLFSTYEDLNFV